MTKSTRVHLTLSSLTQIHPYEEFVQATCGHESKAYVLQNGIHEGDCSSYNKKRFCLNINSLSNSNQVNLLVNSSQEVMF